ncbi:hypothetical protein A6D98_09780 [Aliivibrio fischeri]|uniref:tyrosine-type recombinase/integrase n=1 Tax=Aliivibrio fischeri TaxID=668 RepID=UPI00080E43AA|nr:site-specific integrase [Aliivibrio fischeri]OCH60880.1 hypothetical protein A6D98_09780 [Aliivibrio fischeri]
MKTSIITFSETNIKAEKAGKAVTLRDPAFPLRFRFHQGREKGSWYVVRSDKWYLMGYWPLMTVKAVKKVLPEKLAILALNQSANLQQSEFESVGDALQWYDARTTKDATRSKTRKATIKSAIKCHLMPHLGAFPITALTRQVLDDALIWPLQESHSLSTVKSVLAVLKQVFKQAQKLGRIELNPLAGVVFSDFITVEIKAKDGRLLSTQVSDVFMALSSCDRVTQTLIIMLLCHGTRITETLSAKWHHIDLEAGQWRLPMADTKTREWHLLPLTKQITEWLIAYRTWQNQKGYRGVFVFPGHAHAQSLSYSTARKYIKNVSHNEWSAHDCRKALKTICTDLGIDHSVSERLLNHSQSKLDKAYDQSLYKVPMREALKQYHTWLDNRGFAQLRRETETRSTRSFATAQASECAA